ncbi:MAG TPA: hypothetical protein VG935_04295 [Patescibacteria group bacterium]|nr:hypothetical protein [Patescibacteria group bacterium]
MSEDIPDKEHETTPAVGNQVESSGHRLRTLLDRLKNSQAAMEVLTKEQMRAPLNNAGHDDYNFSQEQQVNRGKILASHNDELDFTHYIVNDPSGETKERPDVEFYISDEAKKLGLDVRTMRQLVKEELDRIHNDPFGKTSIDPELKVDKIWVKAHIRARSRSLNRLADEVQAKVGDAMVIKTNKAPDVETPPGAMPVNLRGGFKEDLIEQYQQMRDFAKKAREKFTPEQLEILRFAKMYGVLRIDDMEYLFMEHVKGGRIKEQYPSSDFRSNVGIPTYWLGVDDHKALLDAFPSFREKIYTDPADGKDYVTLWDIRPKLDELLDIKGGELDLAARNVMMQPHGDHMQYVIIDQNVPGKYQM